MLIASAPGVNFTNVLPDFLWVQIPKAQKRLTTWLYLFIAILGST